MNRQKQITEAHAQTAPVLLEMGSTESSEDFASGNLFPEEGAARHNQKIWGTSPNGMYEALPPSPREHSRHHDPRAAGILGAIALLSLLLPLRAHAQQIRVTTTCTCFAFEDANGKSIHEPLLTNAPLINGTRISSTYGVRMDPILGFFAMHSGVDFAAPADSPIFAPADGVIEEARDKAELGLYVRVRHNQILATGYAHTSHFAAGICPGVHVARGQVIAYVGSTGLSTGPHLHYAVFINGQLIKPVCSCMTQSQPNFGLLRSKSGTTIKPKGEFQ